MIFALNNIEYEVLFGYPDHFDAWCCRIDEDSPADARGAGGQDSDNVGFRCLNDLGIWILGGPIDHHAVSNFSDFKRSKELPPSHHVGGNACGHLNKMAVGEQAAK